MAFRNDHNERSGKEFLNLKKELKRASEWFFSVNSQMDNEIMEKKKFEYSFCSHLNSQKVILFSSLSFVTFFFFWISFFFVLFPQTIRNHFRMQFTLSIIF